MINRISISCVGFFIAGFLGYFISNQLWVGVLSGLLVFLALFFISIPYLMARKEKGERRNEAYRFANSFIISLSVNGSLEESFKSASLFLSPSYREIILHLENLEIIEKIKYLQQYFQESFYDMFVSMVTIWRDQGGDVLHLMEPLLREMGEIEESERMADKSRKRSLMQFLILWLMSAFILLAVRFGLDAFYQDLSSSISFQVVSCLYFVVVSFAFSYFGILVGTKPKGGLYVKKERKSKFLKKK